MPKAVPALHHLSWDRSVSTRSVHPSQATCPRLFTVLATCYMTYCIEKAVILRASWLPLANWDLSITEKLAESHDQRVGCDPKGVNNWQPIKGFQWNSLVTDRPGSVIPGFSPWRRLTAAPSQRAHWTCHQRVPTPSRTPHTMASTCWRDCHLQQMCWFPSLFYASHTFTNVTQAEEKSETENYCFCENQVDSLGKTVKEPP